MCDTKYFYASAKESHAKWAAIRDAAEVLEAVVSDMVQAVADADEEKLLRDKREAVSASISYAQVAESLNLLRHYRFYGTRLADAYNELSQWFAVLQGATTFAQWQECRKEFLMRRPYFYNSYYKISDYASEHMNLFGELVVHYRKELAKENKKRMPAVALPKAVRKEMVRVYCAKQQVKVFPKGMQNLTLYRFACAPTNSYNLVSAAACITQRAEGTVLSTKNWLRLVRTARSNHTHRNAHNLNNRQDYLVRLPVETSKVIRLR